jgi:SAM-dependent methyltransferase
MPDPHAHDPASRFVEHWTQTLRALVPAPARALDVAMGRGRHTRALASAGYRAFGVDIDYAAVHDAVARARDRGEVLHAWCADLTNAPLPHVRFDLILVTRYLQRDLFPALIEALTPGGVLVYETFTEAQRAFGRGPRCADHLLQAGELAQRLDALEMLFCEEVVEAEAVARYVGRRSNSRS